MPATNNPTSTASIAGHPLHPMLVPFPIAFFVAVLASDLVFLSTGNPAWATASLWLLGAGIVMAALAAVIGLVDFTGDARIRALSDAWQHAAANVVAVLLAIASWYWRYGSADAAAAVVPVGVALSVAIALILLYSGWKGGELVFRHGVGVRGERL